MKQKPIDKLLQGYFQACATIGRPLNGLQKLKMRIELKEADADRVLEIIEEVNRIKQLAQRHSISIDANIHAPASQNPQPWKMWNGTTYQYNYTGGGTGNTGGDTSGGSK